MCFRAEKLVLVLKPGRLWNMQAAGLAFAYFFFGLVSAVSGSGLSLLEP